MRRSEKQPVIDMGGGCYAHMIYNSTWFSYMQKLASAYRFGKRGCKYEKRYTSHK